MGNDALGGPAQEKIPEWAFAVATEYDQVGRIARGGLDTRLDAPSRPHIGRAGDAIRCLDCPRKPL